MWEAKIFAGNAFTDRVSGDKFDVCEQADAWASEGAEVWVGKWTADRFVLDKVWKG